MADFLGAGAPGGMDPAQRLNPAGPLVMFGKAGVSSRRPVSLLRLAFLSRLTEKYNSVSALFQAHTEEFIEWTSYRPFSHIRFPYDLAAANCEALQDVQPYIGATRRELYTTTSEMRQFSFQCPASKTGRMMFRRRRLRGMT